MNIMDVARLQAVSTDGEYYQYGPDESECNDTLLAALQSVVFYNGLSEQLKVAKKYLLTQKQKIEGGEFNVQTIRPDSLCSFDGSGNSNDFEQFEIFWMLLVLMFGNYGTSPRYGWINHEQIDDAILFIDWLIDKDEQEGVE